MRTNTIIVLLKMVRFDTCVHVCGGGVRPDGTGGGGSYMIVQNFKAYDSS